MIGGWRGCGALRQTRCGSLPRSLLSPPAEGSSAADSGEGPGQTRSQPLDVFEPSVSGGNTPETVFVTLTNTTKSLQADLGSEKTRPRSEHPTDTSLHKHSNGRNGRGQVEYLHTVAMSLNAEQALRSTRVPTSHELRSFTGPDRALAIYELHEVRVDPQYLGTIFRRGLIDLVTSSKDLFRG